MRKQDGFPGQLSFVIPDRIQTLIRQNPACNDLYITDIGYYPKASHHFRERKEGINQTILIYSVGGKGTIIVLGKEVQLNADHFFIIPEGVSHAYYADGKDPWSIYWIHFTGGKAKHIARPILQQVPVMRSNISRINDRLELFNEIFQSLARGYSMESLEYVNLSLPRLIASFTHLSQYRSLNEQVTKDPVSQSISFMIENLNRKLKLEELSSAVKLSTSHFSRLFSSRTRHSPIDYFIQLKIQRSCRLLDNTNLSIAEVAREMGFEDQFYFSRQFRRVMKMSPREYRQR